MDYLLLSIFILGIVLAILAWHVDKAKHFPKLLRIISSDYADGTWALDLLAENDKHVLPSEHPGFHVLIRHWPELQQKSAVTLISRSIAFVEFGPTVKSDFQLIPRDKNDNEPGARWSSDDARALLLDQFERKSFVFGTVFFYFGIGLSLAAGITEFMSNIKRITNGSS